MTSSFPVSDVKNTLVNILHDTLNQRSSKTKIYSLNRRKKKSLSGRSCERFVTKHETKIWISIVCVRYLTLCTVWSHAIKLSTVFIVVPRSFALDHTSHDPWDFVTEAISIILLARDLWDDWKGIEFRVCIDYRVQSKEYE